MRPSPDRCMHPRASGPLGTARTLALGVHGRARVIRLLTAHARSQQRLYLPGYLAARMCGNVPD
jgi:hypothetical protein